MTLMQKMTRRRRVGTLAVAAAGAAALALAGCSTGGGSTTAGGPVTLTYWMWDSMQVPGYQACATAFEEANPDILINIEQYGWGDYWTQLTARMVAENAPDVFIDHTQQFGKFVEFDQLLDLELLLAESDLDTSQFVDGLVELWEGPEGGLYGVPKDWDTVGVFYNEAMLTEAGYSAEDVWALDWNPVDGGTFEQFIARMTVDENGVRGDEEGFDKNNVAVYGMGYGEAGAAYGQVQWAPFVLSTGWRHSDTNPWGTAWNFDDQRFLDTVSWYTSLIDKGYIPRLAVATSGIGAPDALRGGVYATLVEGSWNARALIEGTGLQVAPTPIGPDGQRASIMNGVADSIWAGTPNPEEAWQWVSYLGSPECQLRMAEEARVFPAITEASDLAVEKFAEFGVDAEAFAVQIDDGTGVPTPISDQWAQITTIMQPAMDSVFAGQAEVDSLVAANNRVNALFN